MPTKTEGLPSTIERSPRKVQRTYTKALDSAHEHSGGEERAHRTAYDAGKDELADALRRHNDRETARARR